MAAADVARALKAARRDLDAGRLTEAERAGRRVLEAEPDNVDALHLLATVALRVGKGEAAIPFLAKAVRARPRSAPLRNALGEAHGVVLRQAEAAACFRRAIALDDGVAVFHNNLGGALYDLGRAGEATACFRRALELEPGLVLALYNLAMIHSHRPGDPAFGELEAALDREGESGERHNAILFALGKAHDDIGAHDRAFGYFRRANEEMAARTTFDAAAHRREIAATMQVFNEPAPPPPAGEPPEGEPVPIFVVGITRSGKSLVESLLARHADVHAGGERMDWLEALKKLHAKHKLSGPYPRFVPSLSAALIAELGESYLAALAARAPRRRFVVDTMPTNFRYLDLIFRALPHARVIHCRRGLMDLCLSIYFRRYAARNSYAYDFDAIAAFCADQRALMDHWLRLHGERILRVRYEELVAEPAATAKRLFAHCGLAPDPALGQPRLFTHEVGRWRHYERHLAPLRRALAEHMQGRAETGE